MTLNCSCCSMVLGKRIQALWAILSKCFQTILFCTYVLLLSINFETCNLDSAFLLAQKPSQHLKNKLLLAFYPKLSPKSTIRKYNCLNFHRSKKFQRLKVFTWYYQRLIYSLMWILVNFQRKSWLWHCTQKSKKLSLNCFKGFYVLSDKYHGL